MQESHSEPTRELTIISRGLLRITSDEWATPEEHFKCLTGNALSQLLIAAGTGSPGGQATKKRALLLFDCLLRVLSEPAVSSPIAFATQRFRELQLLFYGALGSKRFIDSAETTRISLAYNFHSVLENLNDTTPVLLANYRPKAAGRIPDELVHSFEKQTLDDVQVLKLRPYLLRAKSGVEYNVLLGDMVPILGVPFTDAFHRGLQATARPKAKDSALRDFGTTFASYVCHRAANHQPISAHLLADPSFVQIFLVDFMEYHFMKMKRRKKAIQEGTLGSLQKLWSRYRSAWQSLADQKILAAPVSAFPEGNPKLMSKDAVGHRRVTTDENGNTTVITEKLITSVPLHVTDNEATRLLFEQLKADFNIVQTWLTSHLKSFFDDYQAGCQIAAEILQSPAADDVQRATRAIDSEGGLPLAIKYFKEAHGGYIDTSCFPTPVYPDCAARGRVSKESLARYLGIPSRREALAFMALLASHDGRFSESALAAATLLDNTGKRINAVETDAGLTLTVLKERDAGDGWHDVLLKGEVADVVRRWLKVTAPLRSHMKRHGLSGWQNLVIYTGNPLGAPAYFHRSSNINSFFRHFALTDNAKLGNLAKSITISKIRSTRGVLVFLDTMDITQMAKELGNSSETSLKHYLPESLWDYFTTRWLRIFQNLLIVEATRDTPYMQRALRFNSASEMDEFLKNHAVAPIIPREEETQIATAANAHRAPNELMVAASPGIFATLLSIADAASRTLDLGRKLTPQAMYWTEFTRLLKKHIESNAFHDRGIKQMLSAAAANTAPENFMEVVCV